MAYSRGLLDEHVQGPLIIQMGRVCTALTKGAIARKCNRLGVMTTHQQAAFMTQLRQLGQSFDGDHALTHMQPRQQYAMSLHQQIGKMSPMHTRSSALQANAVA